MCETLSITSGDTLVMATSTTDGTPLHLAAQYGDVDMGQGVTGKRQVLC